MKEMKDRYKEDTDTKDNTISGLRNELIERNNTFDNETRKLKETVRKNFKLCYLLLNIYHITCCGDSILLQISIF